MLAIIAGIVGGVAVFVANVVANHYIFGFNYRPVPVYLLALPAIERMNSKTIYIMNTVCSLLWVGVGVWMMNDVPLLAAGFITFGLLSCLGPTFLK